VPRSSTPRPQSHKALIRSSNSNPRPNDKDDNVTSTRPHITGASALSVIDGQRVDLGGEALPVFDPSTGQQLCEISDVGAAGVDTAVRSARKGFDAWSAMTFRERSDRLVAFANAYEARAEEFGALEALDVGKPVAAAVAEVASCAERFRFFAIAARTLTAPNPGNYRGTVTSIARRQPVGVVGAITPWNYPMGLGTWKIAPALAAGCALVLKPAAETPFTSLLMAELAAEFLPAGVFNVITGGGATGDALVRHPDVPMISMTGGTATGKNVMRAAADHVKKVHLELGGPSAVIVFDDADLDWFEAVLPKALWRNTGQDCHALSRIYAHEDVRERVVDILTRSAETQTIGDAFDDATVIGPMATSAQRDRVAGLVDQTVGTGHVVATTGAHLPDRAGFFYPATILDGVLATDVLKQTEIFGPVASVTTFRDTADVLGWVNDSPFGLSASVWTSRLDRAMDVSEALETGTVWVNDHSTTVTEMPFGGWKESGVGRELSTAVLEDHMEFKHIAIGRRSS
jgi:acyl-CoA reductase-like NAD-dependent aldehyde dehydrogenase